MHSEMPNIKQHETSEKSDLGQKRFGLPFLKCAAGSFCSAFNLSFCRERQKNQSGAQKAVNRTPKLR